MEKNKKAYTIFVWAALCLLAFTFIFPLYWIVTGSFKMQTATVQLPPQWFPLEPTTANYVKLFKNPAGLWLWNSVFQSAMATLLTCFTASLAGYALAKKRFTGAKLIFALFVCAMALPKQVVMVPLVRIMAAIGLYNTSWAVIFPTVGWPFGVFLMKQFSETLPSELLEAARIDGAGELRTFWSIVLPIVKPGVATIALLNALAYWNEWFLALLYIRKNTDVIPLQYLLMKMQRNADFIAKNSHLLGAEAANVAVNLPSQSLKMALVVLIVIPIACAYPFFQRFVVAGLTIGSVKG